MIKTVFSGCFLMDTNRFSDYKCPKLTRQDNIQQYFASEQTMSQKINRRDFVKASLAGSGIILGGALLSNKWIKPAAALSKLPAHSLASAIPTEGPTATAIPTLEACSSDYTFYPIKSGTVSVRDLYFIFLVPSGWDGDTIDWTIDAAPTIDTGTIQNAPSTLSGSFTIKTLYGQTGFLVYAKSEIDPPYVTADPSTCSFTATLSHNGGTSCSISANGTFLAV